MDKGGRIALFSPHQIIDFARKPPAPIRPTHPLHYTLALAIQSEARYVIRRQGRGLGVFIAKIRHQLEKKECDFQLLLTIFKIVLSPSLICNSAVSSHLFMVLLRFYR